MVELYALLLLAPPLLLTYATLEELPPLAEANHQFVRAPSKILTADDLWSFMFEHFALFSPRFKQRDFFE